LRRFLSFLRKKNKLKLIKINKLAKSLCNNLKLDSNNNKCLKIANKFRTKKILSLKNKKLDKVTLVSNSNSNYNRIIINKISQI